jgi:hypothetical protein
MKAKITILVIISFLLVSCGTKLAVPGTEVPAEASVSNVSMTQEPLTTDMPIPDFTLSAMLQGNWLVEITDAGEDWTTLGTLAIDGNDYRFYPVPGVEIPSWMRDRFCFFEQSAGEVGFEYEPAVSPHEDVRTFEDHDILLRWTNIGCKETFLIRVDQEAQELYLHAQVSEIQSYRIHKSYIN